MSTEFEFGEPCACGDATIGKVTYSEHLSHPDKKLFTRRQVHNSYGCVNGAAPCIHSQSIADRPTTDLTAGEAAGLASDPIYNPLQEQCCDRWPHDLRTACTTGVGDDPAKVATEGLCRYLREYTGHGISPDSVGAIIRAAYADQTAELEGWSKAVDAGLYAHLVCVDLALSSWPCERNVNAVDCGHQYCRDHAMCQKITDLQCQLAERDRNAQAAVDGFSETRRTLQGELVRRDQRIAELTTQLAAWDLHEKVDHPGCYGPPLTTPESRVPQMDWEQVRQNGGPPCYALLGETMPDGETAKYCGRAKRWAGHYVLAGHPFVAVPFPQPPEAQPSDGTTAAVDRHSGAHGLLSETESVSRPNRIKPGWMWCYNPICNYTAPALGWCVEHQKLDTCWSVTA